MESGRNGPFPISSITKKGDMISSECQTPTSVERLLGSFPVSSDCESLRPLLS